MLNPDAVWYKDTDNDGYSDGATMTSCTRPIGFIDYIINIKHEAFSLGWVTNQGIEQSLDAKLDNAKKKLEQGNTTAAKNILEAFINEVEAQKDKHLTSEGYGLLKYNVGYLIGRL